MKGFGFSSILLVLTTVLIVISVALMGLVVYRAANAAGTVTVNTFWATNKLYMMAPTVMNVVSMALLGVLFAMG